VRGRSDQRVDGGGSVRTPELQRVARNLHRGAGQLYHRRAAKHVEGSGAAAAAAAARLRTTVSTGGNHGSARHCSHRAPRQRGVRIRAWGRVLPDDSCLRGGPRWVILHAQPVDVEELFAQAVCQGEIAPDARSCAGGDERLHVRRQAGSIIGRPCSSERYDSVRGDQMGRLPMHDGTMQPSCAKRDYSVHFARVAILA
jgi:hypothetical protein